MPLRNRVTPEGNVIADPARGLFMGNRGILHDTEGRIVRAFRSRAWITCLLAFKHRLPPVPMVSPGRYTRLFFLDEAVALAAGHRPCAECRRADYNRFRAAWDAAGLGNAPRAPEIDRCLHSARISPRSRVKRTHRAELSSLPDGVFVRTTNGQCLIHGGRLLCYEPGGYSGIVPLPSGGDVEVLTPAPLVAVIRAGYRPILHPSAL